MDEQKDRYIVNGAHDAEKLATILDVFIDKFVLCAECKNPETVFIFEKNDLIKMDCKACGAKSEVDLRHKLVGYIQKHKPEQQKYFALTGTIIKKLRLQTMLLRVIILTLKSSKVRNRVYHKKI